MPPRPDRRTTLATVDNRPPTGSANNGTKPKGSRMSMIPRPGRENPTPPTPSSSRDNNRRKTLAIHPNSSSETAPTAVQPAQANNRRQSIAVQPLRSAVNNRRKSNGAPPVNSVSNDRRKSMKIPPNGAPENRRQSMGLASENRRQSIGVSQTNAAPVAKHDTRNVNDKNFQKECIKKIYQFLVQSGYNHDVSPKTIARPSGRDFSLIISFMLRKVDPWFQMGSMKFEDEVAMNFKALGYPFPVSKTALVAAGSPHTWPAMLAALVWLVDFLICFQTESNQEAADEDPIESLEVLEQRTDQIFFKYLGEAYGAFMSNDMKASEQLEIELAERFEEDDAIVKREVERVAELNSSLCETMEILKSEGNDMPIYDAKRSKYAADLEQLQELLAQIDERKLAYESKIASARSELEETNRKLEAVNAQVEKLNETIKLQKLSVYDAEKIDKERKGVEEAIERKTKSKRQLQGRLTAVDEELQVLTEQLKAACHEFNAFSSDISAFSLVQARNVNLTITVDGSPSLNDSPTQILGVDPEFSLQHVLQKCKNEYTELLEMTQIQKQEATEAISAKEGTLASETTKLQDTRKRLDVLKDRIWLVQQEHAAKIEDISSELEALDTKLASLQDPSAIDAEYAQIELKFAELKIARNQQREQHNLTMQNLQDEISQACQAITEYEEYYRTKVAELKEYAKQKAANKPVLKVPDF